jgi:putative ABC transport system permease protein
MLNFDAGAATIPPYVLGLEVAAGLCVPLLAALWPVLSAARISVLAAFSAHGGGSYGAGRLDRAMARLGFLSRPLLLSLRNTVRRRGRLALTLSTLILAGAMVITVASVRDSLRATTEGFFTTYGYDVGLVTERPYRLAPLLAAARATPAVVAAEGWSISNGRRVLDDGTKTPNIRITALPPDSRLFKPRMLRGRWLLPADENAIVVNSALLQEEPDLDVGDMIVLDLGGRESSWRIVGVAQVLIIGRSAYTSYDYTSRVTGDVGQASFVPVLTDQRDPAAHTAIGKALRAQYKAAGLGLMGTEVISDMRSQINAQFDILVAMLLMMALLLAVVGGLGLMGTMSINVLERTREIGVMRAIGASNGAILRLVMVEGLLIGLVSWLAAVLAAYPFGRLLSDAVGQAFLQTAPDHAFSLAGAAAWLAAVIALATLACFLPAWNASRVTIRDVLAYE